MGSSKRANKKVEARSLVMLRDLRRRISEKRLLWNYQGMEELTVLMTDFRKELDEIISQLMSERADGVRNEDLAALAALDISELEDDS